MLAWALNLGFAASGAVDLAPVLSNPTGTATGADTATGTVDTDEGNGALYFYASTNSSETAANIKLNGSSQAVSATGTQNVTFSGLTPETGYYAHYVHDDSSSNESNVQSSSQFTTSAVAVVPSGIKRTLIAGKRGRDISAGSRNRTLH